MDYVLIALHGTKDNIQGYRLLDTGSGKVQDFTQENLYSFISSSKGTHFYGIDIKDRRGNLEFTQAHHARYTYLFNDSPSNGVHLVVVARSNNGGGTVNTLANAKISTGGTVAPFKGSFCSNYTSILNGMGALVQIPVGREMTDSEIKSWIGQAVFKRNKCMRLTTAEEIVLRLLNAKRKITANEVRNLIFATTDNSLVGSSRKQLSSGR